MRFNTTLKLVGKEDYNVWKLYRRMILLLCAYDKVIKKDIVEFTLEFPIEDWNKAIEYVAEWVKVE